MIEVKNIEKAELITDALMQADPNYKSEIEEIESDYGVKISVDIEKHNSLQHTYYYDIDFGLEENLYLEIESGINNGTRLNSDTWGVSTKEKTKTIEVLKDIVVVREKCKNDLQYHKAIAVLSQKKQSLFDFERQNNYDNYVTGGNSRMKITDELTKELLGLIEYVYEEKEVDRNFV